MIVKSSVFIVAVVGAVLACGCESDLIEQINDKEANVSTAALPNTSVATGDAIPIGSISWLGENYSGASKSATLNSASMSGDTLNVSYEPYSWPSQTVKVKVDAVCCLFYERGGQIVGGKYDFWRAGGQGAKGLENVRHRYQGHSWPAAGAKVYTMNVSMDGSQRSNIVEVSR